MDALGFSAVDVITVAVGRDALFVVLSTGGSTDSLPVDEPETNVIEAEVGEEEDAEMVTEPAPVPVTMGKPTSSTAPDSMIVVVESASLICSVHTALPPAIPHWTSTCSVSSAVAMIAPSETCVASSTSVTGDDAK